MADSGGCARGRTRSDHRRHHRRERGPNQFSLVPDDNSTGGVLIIADAMTTQFNGFGGVINGKPEIFTGSQGFSNVRIGDRVEARGLASSNGTIQADIITLRGRSVAAAPTGVGQTRAPGSVSVPTQTTVTQDRTNRVEGVVRQVNQDNNSLVIETDRRDMITVRAEAGTPVYYRNEVYHVSNLEVGDRIRVEPDTASSTTGDIRARIIDVIHAVQDTGGAAPSATVSGLSGRVTRIDQANDVIRSIRDAESRESTSRTRRTRTAVAFARPICRSAITSS